MGCTTRIEYALVNEIDLGRIGDVLDPQRV